MWAMNLNEAATKCETNTKHFIEEILKIEAVQKKRIENNKLLFYNTGKIKHQKQLAFHQCSKKNRWVFGGNRTGKTECGAVEVVYMARGCHPYRKITTATSGWVVSLSTQVQRDVAQSKVLKYINPDWIVDVVMLSGRKDSYTNGIIDYIIIKNVFGTTSKIGFKSCDQGREKFRGTSLDYVWFDEEPPYDIYQECRMRVLDTNGDIFATMTPLKGMTFVYDEIYLNKFNDPNVWCEFISWQDNPYISKQAVEAMKAGMSADELRSREFGEFVDAGGRVYPEFDENVNVIEPFDVPYDWQDKLSIDPGLKNPRSCHWYAVDYDGNMYCYRELYGWGGKPNVGTGETAAEVGRRICELEKKEEHVDYGVLDSACWAKTGVTGPTIAEELNNELYKKGIVTFGKCSKGRVEGANAFKQRLIGNKQKDGSYKPAVYFFNTCIHAIRTIPMLAHDKHNPETYDTDGEDHVCDAACYAMLSRPWAPTKPEAQKPRDKYAHKEAPSVWAV